MFLLNHLANINTKACNDNCPGPGAVANPPAVSAHSEPLDGLAQLASDMAARHKAALRLELLGRNRTTMCQACGQLLDHQGAGVWSCGCGLKRT
jgi:hypothetical protein